MSIKNHVFAVSLLAAVLCPVAAFAALGEPESSVQADTAQLHGSIKLIERAGYRLHEIQLPSGTTVHEFVAANGNVFAVTWSGPTVPNLRQTLGQYFDRYAVVMKAKHSGHNHLQIQENDLVVHVNGHMRVFSGIAYLPLAIPTGVSIGDLR